MEQSVAFEWNQDASDGVTEVLVEVVGLNRWAYLFLFVVFYFFLFR